MPPQPEVRLHETSTELPVSMARSNHREHNILIERIKSVRAELYTTSDPHRRNKLNEELGEATKELVELVLQREGRLKSPLEARGRTQEDKD